MKEIKFKRTSTFLGRNGEFKSTGLRINLTFDNGIFIEPITSKDKTGRAYLAIPIESIPELIEALKSLAPSKNDKIKEIKEIIMVWGSVGMGELTFCDHSPCISSIGNGKDNISQLIEAFKLDYVAAVTYQDELELGEEMIDYEDLSDELIDEVHDILKQHDELMKEENETL